MKAIAIVCVSLAVAFAAAQSTIVGTDFVGRGVDVTTMKMGLAPIFRSDTFTFQQQWTNPQTGVTYNVPDAYQVGPAEDVSVLTNKTTSFDGVTSVQRWAYHHYSWHSGFLGMCSNSMTTYEFVGRYFQEDESSAHSELVVKFLNLQSPLIPPLQPMMSPSFLTMVGQLPDAIATDADYHTYRQFFTNVGTAVMDTALLGGRLQGTTWYAKCLIDAKSQSYVNQQSSWSFLGIIGGGSGHSSTDYHLDDAFAACYKSFFEYQGGNSTSYRPNEYLYWIPTTYNAPWPVSFTLQPMNTVLELLGENTKAATMATALTRYLTEAQSILNSRVADAQANDPNIQPHCCQMAREMAKRGL